MARTGTGDAKSIPMLTAGPAEMFGRRSTAAVLLAGSLILMSCSTEFASSSSTELARLGDDESPTASTEVREVSAVPIVSSPETPDQRVEAAADSITAMDRNLAGGSYQIGIPAEAITGAADIGLEVSVVDIKPAILNTPSGRWDPKTGTSAGELHDQWGLLLPYTVVVVRVERVLGARENVRLAIPGTDLEIWFLGGSVTMEIAADDARLIGLEGDVRQIDEESPSDANLGTEVEGDLVRTIQMAHAVYFEEGDELILFGRLDPRPTNSEEPSGDSVLWTLAPQGAGVFVADSGIGVIDAATSAVADREFLIEVARSLVGISIPSRRYDGS